MAYTQIGWSWTQGSGGTATGFHVKCGRASGVYTISTTVNDPVARTLSVYTATMSLRGLWYATVDAFHTTNGTSSDGNEVTFILPFNDPASQRPMGFGFGF